MFHSWQCMEFPSFSLSHSDLTFSDTLTNPHALSNNPCLTIHASEEYLLTLHCHFFEDDEMCRNTNVNKEVEVPKFFRLNLQFIS